MDIVTRKSHVERLWDQIGDVELSFKVTDKLYIINHMGVWDSYYRLILQHSEKETTDFIWKHRAKINYAIKLRDGGVFR